MITMFGGNFAPAGWMFCQGQLLPISEYETLYNLIGTTFGGDGQNTFGLPDLRGRIPVHQGGSFVLGQIGGTETVTLTLNQIPVHTHTQLAQNASSSTTSTSPTNNVPSAGPSWFTTNAPVSADALANPAASTVGGSQPHDNMPPYLVVSFIISLFGVYPSQN
jgi:microcystin-dependent protein